MAPRKHWLWKPWMNSLCLVAFVCPAAHAQLAISLDEQGGVRLQNGDQPPLVVGPGQSFGGTLTSHGFQGVMTDSSGPSRNMQSSWKNPFRDVPRAERSALGTQGLQINAGGLSVSLPGAPVPPAASPSTSLPMTPAQWARFRELLRTQEPAAALAEIDRVLARSPLNADALQMKALVMMQMSRVRDAAACVYDVMSQNATWSWPMLRSCFSTREEVEALYRHLQSTMDEMPTAEQQLLLVWWERMLGHAPEAHQALEQLRQRMPHDALLARLHREWSVEATTDAPPAAHP